MQVGVTAAPHITPNPTPSARRIDAAEIKRMYVAPAWRGRGLSRVLLAAIEADAAAAGIGEIVLNTGPEQPEAIALYLSSGYTDVAGFGHYADLPGALFYGKSIAANGHPAGD